MTARYAVRRLRVVGCADLARAVTRSYAPGWQPSDRPVTAADCLTILISARAAGVGTVATPGEVLAWCEFHGSRRPR
jgi:hypothetical protein